MPKITITGMPGVDGEYLLDLEGRKFTGNELHLIKNVSGARVGEIGDAMAAGDYDLVVALAKIALDRAGRDVPVEALLAAEVGALQFGPTDEEKAAEAEEALLPPTPEPSKPPGTSSETSTSGSSSTNGSDSHQESSPLVTGQQHLVTGSASVREISAI